MANAEAVTAIKQFATRTGPGRWHALKRDKLAEQMKARLDKPYLVKQGPAGLCGPTAIVYEMLHAKPVDYVCIIANLFDIGASALHRWELKPRQELLNAPLPTGIDDADWIISASIRDNDDWFQPYTKAKDDGTTLNDDGASLDREMVKWLEKAGFRDIKSDTYSLNWGNKAANLATALSLYKKKYQVILSIQSGAMRSQTPKDLYFTPNHYVVLNGEFAIPASKSDTIKIPVFTWGRETTLPETGKFNYGQVLDLYFGYIAAK
jgi:hypothetical protein